MTAGLELTEEDDEVGGYHDGQDVYEEVSCRHVMRMSHQIAPIVIRVFFVCIFSFIVYIVSRMLPNFIDVKYVLWSV